MMLDNYRCIGFCRFANQWWLTRRQKPAKTWFGTSVNTGAGFSSGFDAKDGILGTVSSKIERKLPSIFPR
jgi:hypothetical protein